MVKPLKSQPGEPEHVQAWSGASEILPVSLNVHPGDSEAQLRCSSNRNAITSSGEMEQFLL